jgi:PhzF family phenazine biosynthesis protein
MRIFQVDSFTDKMFNGNPAGVCLLTNSIPDSLMQNIAMEMNLSETAFIKEIEDQIFSIRFFTPIAEVDLCGHASLAAAKVVNEVWSYEKIIFNANRDLIEAKMSSSELQMTFPKSDYVECLDNQEILEALGMKKCLNTAYSEKISMLIIETHSERELVSLKPDFRKLLNLQLKQDLNGIAVTTKSSNILFDFKSRCFWPWIGIDEDPVTGAAHTALAPYWQKRLAKDKLKAFQISKRGGKLDLQITNEHILIHGQAVIVFSGKFYL